MPTPFGFSVGDFVTVLNLFKDIGVALRDHGGASDSYRRTVEELETIQAVLLQLQNCKAAAPSLTQINAIRAQAHHSQVAVSHFLNKIAKYNAALGARSPGGFRNGTVSKMKWATMVVNEVNQLRGCISSQCQTIQLLLTVHTLESLADSSRQRGETPARFQTPVRDYRGAAHLLRSSRYLPQTATTTIPLSLQAELEEIRNAVSEIKNVIANQINTSTEQETKDALVGSVTKKSKATLVKRESGLMRHPYKKYHQPSTSYALAELSTQDGYQSAPATIAGLVHMMLLTLLHHLGKIYHLWPQMFWFLQLLRRIPRSVPYLLQSNMRFTDVLGRVHSLQYEQFRHWDVFEANLRCVFQGLPGESRVAGGNYRIMSSRSCSTKFDAMNWERFVSPGTELVMAIEINSSYCRVGKCPRCSGQTIATPGGLSSCRYCGLNFSAEPPEALTEKNVFHSLRDVSGVIVWKWLAHMEPSLSPGAKDDMVENDPSYEASAIMLSDDPGAAEEQDFFVFKRIHFRQRVAPQPRIGSGQSPSESSMSRSVSGLSYFSAPPSLPATLADRSRSALSHGLRSLYSLKEAVVDILTRRGDSEPRSVLSGKSLFLGAGQDNTECVLGMRRMRSYCGSYGSIGSIGSIEEWGESRYYANSLGSGRKWQSTPVEKLYGVGYTFSLSSSNSCATTWTGKSYPGTLASDEALAAEHMVFHRFGHDAPEHIDDVAIEPVPNITAPAATVPAATESHWRKLKKRMTKALKV